VSGEPRGTVLVLGATSGIARGTAAALARRGYPLHLAARDGAELTRVAADLGIRFGVPVRASAFDALATEDHPAFLADVLAEGPLAGVVLAVGALGDAARARTDPGEAEAIFRANFTGPASILTLLANHFEAAGGGFLVGISSVSGDRGRAGNYAYGAAKAALTAFLSGLRQRLFAKGVRVITVKPGFVDTAMTFGMDGLFLVAAPEAVGERIARKIEGRGDVLYVPWFWRWIMAAIRAIPEPLFKRLSL